MKRGSQYNFQRVYPYVCKGCKKRRGTRIYERREDELCTLCRKKEIDKNQMSLLPVGVDEKGAILTANSEGEIKPLDNEEKEPHN